MNTSIKPKGSKEFSLRAILCSILVAAIMGASYPYIVLKLGFGPNVSVVAAFFGFIIAALLSFLTAGFLFKGFTRWENNIIQTAGTAAAQTAFMCIVLAAFDMLKTSQTVDFKMSLTSMQSFLWLTASGLLASFLSVPMRRHFIVEEKLTYADGVAAGETIIILDSRGSEAFHAACMMAAGAVASAALMLMTEDAYVLKWFPSTFLFGTAMMQAMGIGLNWSFLSVGSGMLVGMRIDFSMILGLLISWILAPYALLHYGIISNYKKWDVLMWIMWPAVGMLVAGGLTTLVLRWKILVKTFQNFSSSSVGSEEFPLRWVIVGALLSATALIIIQKFLFDLNVIYTLVAIGLSIPLMLVGLRVLGETNWGPISQLTNLMQAVFGALAPGNISVNMLGSGTTGTIAVTSEALMQSYKTGFMVNSTPRSQMYAQLLGIPIGALAVSYMYPLLRSTYGIGGDLGLSSPISRRLAGFAEILSQGFQALPKWSLAALVVASIVGVILATIESHVSSKTKNFIPSPTGLGIGMLVPASVVIMMFLGGVLDWAWRKSNPRSNELYMTPLASGLIAGEAIIAVIIPLLVALGLIHP